MLITTKTKSYRGFFIITLLLGILGVNGCKKDTATSTTSAEIIAENKILSEYLNLPNWPFNYEEKGIPMFLDVERISTHDNTPITNPITNNGATLGRVLFYDKYLSQNNTISCSNCHNQENGFSDTLTLSNGFDGGKTGRHSMGLSNARYRANGHFFWDERAETLEDQVLGPIQDAVEMGMDLNNLVVKLQMQPYYPILFKRAFGDSVVSSVNISRALAQFVRSMVSFNSPFDQGRANHDLSEPFSNFTPQENHGKEIFHSLDKGMCASCHFTEAMITDEARNNGLTREPSDIGLEAVTGNALDRGKFKAPSLRNIAVRPPYMHNGDYKNLRSVINGYSTGILWSPTLDAHLMTPGNLSAVEFNLSEKDKDALEAFLHTLTDEEFLTNVIYSDPFKK